MSHNTTTTPPRQQRGNVEAPNAPLRIRNQTLSRFQEEGVRRLDFDNVFNFGVKSKRVYALKQ